MLTVIIMVIDFTATIAFSLAGCLILADRPSLYSLPPATLCSFGGGLCRDIILCLVTGFYVAPVAFSSYSLWGAALTGVVLYIILRRYKKVKLLNCGWIKWVRIILDGAGCGEFLVSGILRSTKFGVVNPVLLALLGSVTALGGGFLSLLFFRKNKKQAVRSNIGYYATSIVPASIIATTWREIASPEAISVLTAFSCATVSVIILSLSEYCQTSTHLPSKDPSIARKIGLQLSPGSLFHKVRSPLKGVQSFSYSSWSANTVTKHLIIPGCI